MAYRLPSDDELPRRPIGPRLVDRLEAAGAPRPPKEPLPAHLIKPTDVVPPEDNPLRGWRALGLLLMDDALWTADVRTNPVMVYFSGRRRGRVAEDLFTLLPYLAMLAAELALLFAVTLFPMKSLRFAVLMQIVAIPFLAGLWSVLCTSIHLRRNLDALPLEELLLTRLRPVDIVQGLGVRPVVVQLAGLACYSFLHLLTVLAATYVRMDRIPLDMAFVSSVGLWFMFAVAEPAVELGAAVAVRANLFFRNGWMAWVRATWDWMLVFLWILGTILVLLLCVGAAFTSFFPLLVALIAFIMGIHGIPSWVRDFAFDAITWSTRNFQEWWIYEAIGDLDESFGKRNVFAPWRVMTTRHRFGLPKFRASDSVKRAYDDEP